MHHGRKTSVKANLQDVVKRCLNTSDPVILNQLADELRKRRPNKNLEDLEYFDLLATQSELPDFMKTPGDQPEPEQNDEHDDSESNHSGNNDSDDPNDSDDSEQSENEDIEFADTDSEAETHEVAVNPADIFHADSDSDNELTVRRAEP